MDELGIHCSPMRNNANMPKIRIIMSTQKEEQIPPVVVLCVSMIMIMVRQLSARLARRGRFLVNTNCPVVSVSAWKRVFAYSQTNSLPLSIP